MGITDYLVFKANCNLHSSTLIHIRLKLTHAIKKKGRRLNNKLIKMYHKQTVHNEKDLFPIYNLYLLISKLLTRLVCLAAFESFDILL